MKSLYVVPLVALMGVLFYVNMAQGHGKHGEYRQLIVPMGITERFVDSGTGKWEDNWFLDSGKSWFFGSAKVKVTNGPEGMTIDTAKGGGVLWTKASYDRPIQIEYDFKRLDENDRGANIILIQATGDGEKGFDEDISKWSNKRKGDKLEDYYDNMHAYHMSYAAYDEAVGKAKTDTIRGRRYLPTKGKGLEGTELDDTHTNTGLFDDHQWVHVTITKFDYVMWVEFKHPKKRVICKLENRWLPPISKGRIGLFLSPKRKSQFKNFKISTMDNVTEIKAKREKAQAGKIKKKEKVKVNKPNPKTEQEKKDAQKRSERAKQQHK